MSITEYYFYISAEGRVHHAVVFNVKKKVSSEFYQNTVPFQLQSILLSSKSPNVGTRRQIICSY